VLRYGDERSGMSTHHSRVFMLRAHKDSPLGARQALKLQLAAGYVGFVRMLWDACLVDGGSRNA
jgi:hypothetical protein